MGMIFRTRELVTRFTPLRTCARGGCAIAINDILNRPLAEATALQADMVRSSSSGSPRASVHVESAPLLRPYSQQLRGLSGVATIRTHAWVRPRENFCSLSSWPMLSSKAASLRTLEGRRKASVVPPAL